MLAEDEARLAGRQVPEPNGPILPGPAELPAVRGEGQLSDGSVVTVEGVKQGTSPQVPDDDLGIVTPRREILAIGAERHRVDMIGMLFLPDVISLPRPRVPN